MLIRIDQALLKCPKCAYKLALEKPGAEKHTTCTNKSCTYTEVAGSPYYATYFGAVLKHYINEKGVEDVYIGKQIMPIDYLFNPRGMLDALLMRTHELVQESFFQLEMGKKLFSVIADDNAVLKRRVVISAQVESPADAINRMVTYFACGSYAIDETLKISKDNTQNYQVGNFQLGDMVTTGHELKLAFPEYFDAPKLSKSLGVNR